MLNETNNAIEKIDVEVETIEKLKQGEAPPTPQLSAKSERAEVTAEPVIKIVEVTPFIIVVILLI